MCQDFCLATIRNVGHGRQGHSALRNGRQRIVHEGTHIFERSGCHLYVLVWKVVLQPPVIKLCFYWKPQGCHQVVLRVITLSRDRCHPDANKASTGSNRLDIAQLSNANDHHRMTVCGAPVVAQHFLPKELSS